jgi:cell envelope opacity-associated protein A
MALITLISCRKETPESVAQEYLQSLASFLVIEPEPESAIGRALDAKKFAQMFSEKLDLVLTINNKKYVMANQKDLEKNYFLLKKVLDQLKVKFTDIESDPNNSSIIVTTTVYASGKSTHKNFGFNRIYDLQFILVKNKGRYQIQSGKTLAQETIPSAEGI